MTDLLISHATVARIDMIRRNKVVVFTVSMISVSMTDPLLHKCFDIGKAEPRQICKESLTPNGQWKDSSKESQNIVLIPES